MAMYLQETTLDTVERVGFTLFQKRTPLLTAGDRRGCNTMTIGWGGLGTLWRKPVCTVYVRPQRYTYEFMEQNNWFTVSILPETMEEALRICGTKSGRDIDKCKSCGLTVGYAEGDAPYPKEAELVLVCRKLYADDLRPEKFTDASLNEAFYPEHDYHRAYVGEIVQVLAK